MLNCNNGFLCFLLSLKRKITKNKHYRPLSGSIKLMWNIMLIFILTYFISCKKDPMLPIPGVINGPQNICPGEANITYSIDPIDGSTFYLWTIPDDSKIISGQGTTSIVLLFGKKSGFVCVRANNDTKVSEASCLEVSQGGVSNRWCREMDFKGGGRTEGVGFSIGNKGYVGTGIDSIAGQYNDFWEYDPVLNSWTQKADFAGLARLDAVGFSIGNKGYIGTGYIVSGYLNDFWEYDPILNLWTQKANCGDTTRAFAFGFSIGDKGYLGSGSDETFNTRTDFYEYDPELDQWTRKADVVPRRVGVGFSIGNKGYLGLGNDGISNRSDFWEFDPNDSSNGFDVNNNPIGRWSEKANFPAAPRYAAVGFSIGNKGYLGTGYDGDFYYRDFYEYDPLSNSWMQKTELAGEGRSYAVGFSINKNGYIGIGNNGNKLLGNFWVYGQ